MIGRIFSSLLFISCLLTALQAQAIHVDNDVHYEIEVLLDKTNTLSLEQARASSNYKDVPKSRLGFIDHTVWFHIKVSKKLPTQNRYILKYDFVNVQDLIAYEYKDTHFSNTMYFGSNYITKEHSSDYEYFLTPLDFSQATTYEYYIKIKHFGSVPTLFSFLKESQFVQILSHDKLFDGILYGILGIMVFYNAILFFITRMRYYLYYVALVTFNLLYQLTIRGLSTHYIWPNFTFLTMSSDTLFALLFIQAGVVFIIKLLDINYKNHPKIFALLIIELLLITVLLLGTIFFKLTGINNHVGLLMNAYSMIPILSLFITIISVAYYLAIKGSRTAVLFSIAWSFFTLTIVIYILQIFGSIPSFSWSNNLVALGSVSEVILLALILADKINLLNGEKVRLQFNNQELEELVNERTKELQHQLYTDQLSGLKNRFSLIHSLQQSDANLIMLIDIDSFSQINDLYGIQVGNQILVQFSKKLQRLAHQSHLELYRLGADEFVLQTVLQEGQDITSYMEVAQKLLEAIESQSYNIEEINESIELDITIALVHNQTNLLNKADMTIQTARLEGSKILLYQDTFDHTYELQKNLYYKKEIRLALEEDRFVCFFQPIVSATNKKQKFELLMRLKQNENGVDKFISPYEFLDISIKTKQYEQLSRYVLEKGIKSVQDLDCDLTLNLSFIEIKNPEFRLWFKTLLQKYHMFERVVIEILEDASLEDYNLMRNFSQEFQSYGARIAIDDFGSGFSNFTHIMELRPNYIKIDGSIIKNIHNDAHSYSVVKAIVLLAKEIDAKTIAEFVHNQEVYEMVQALGVDEFQGYYIAEPQPLF